WVRQNFINYLVKEIKYPPSVIAIEKEIQGGELKKRVDILIYKYDKPWMVIECKEMEVALTEKVLQQVLNYNMHLQAAFLLITNGKENMGFSILNNTISRIAEVPAY
ncbi:MAG: type I restriction enzyme HsdR N-terminal domain-containing protein, partial [Sediminibacterium sp.]|nr:type I restriction enzyme HsdR N-terminal domain-containing protein [Sediminibacterium sp.]